MGKDRDLQAYPKRFYETVEVSEQGDGHGILLDGRGIRTPLKRPLAVSTRPLADAIAAEWRVQEDRIVPARMPLTKLANTAIDRAAANPRAIVEEFLSYAGSDMVCYRAETPEGLVARQAAHWDPPLAWAAQRLGCELSVTTGVVHQPQPEAALEALRRRVENGDHFRLTALQTLTALTGSAVLALALSDGVIGGDAVWAASNVEEDWQTEQWGRDAEAERQRASRRCEFDAARRFLELL